MGNSDTNLIVGLVALEAGLIDGASFAAAMRAWSEAKNSSLPEILLEQGALDGDKYARLGVLMKSHWEHCDNDPARGLSAALSRTSLGEALGQFSEVDMPTNLAQPHDASRDRAAPDCAQDHSTRSYSIGASTPCSGGSVENDIVVDYAADDLTSPQVRFRSLHWHADGGMGEVYIAADEELHREVAVKRLKQKYADNSDVRARFVLEAEVTGRLEHPGIVPVYGLGRGEDGRPFYAMRFIRGESLRVAIGRYHGEGTSHNDDAQRALEFRRLLGSFVDVCYATAYAHSRGVLHRDLKPSNIMLGKYGETLLVDWGLAKVIGRRETSETPSENTLDPTAPSGELTHMGSHVGTPAYMCPEQAAGAEEASSFAADIYSLGATLYTLLTGKAAFQGTEAAQVLRDVQQGIFPPPRAINRLVPRALEAVCLKAMAHCPNQRYNSARELAEEVERWLADEPVSAYIETPKQWLLRLVRRRGAERIRDAGVFALFSSLFHVGWGITAVLFVVTGVIRSYYLEGVNESEFLWGVLGTQLAIWVPMGVFGWYGIDRRLWALWAGFALSVWVIVFAGSWGFSQQLVISLPLLTYGGVYANATDRIALATLEVLLATGQLIAYVVAIIAYYSNRHALPLSRSSFRPRRPR